MIRSSMLNLACGHAARLAQAHPEGSHAAEAGCEFHASVASAWAARVEPGTTVSTAIWHAYTVLDGLADDGWAVRVEVPCTVDGAHAGTADVVATRESFGEKELRVIDWKTGQPDNTPDPAGNWQLLSYAEAIARAEGPFVSVECTIGDVRSAVRLRPWHRITDMGAVSRELQRRRTLPDEPVIGDQCYRCYQRHYCDSYRARVSLACAVLGSTDVATADTGALAQALLLSAEAEKSIKLVRDEIRARIEAEKLDVRDSTGRVYRSSYVAGAERLDHAAAIAALERAGIDPPMTAGAGSTRWAWSRGVAR